MIELFDDDILKHLGAANFRRTRLTRSCATLPDEAALLDALGDWSGAPGWIALQSSIHIGAPPPAPPWGGRLIAAEYALERRSLHIASTPDGWAATEIAETEDGEAALVDEVRHLAVSADPEGLLYRRFWTVNAEGALEQIAWRFAGFSDGATA